MITIEEAKVHLRVDHDSEDADIEARLRMASAIVLDYLGSAAIATDHSYDIEDAATLLVLGELYTNRESSSNPLSPSVRGLLERLRAPGYA